MTKFRISLLFLVSVALSAQQYVISTVAGGGPPATAIAKDTSLLPAPLSLTTDAAGNVYFSAGSRVWKLSPNGVMTVIAGASPGGYSGDGGPAISAQLSSYICGLALDSDGNLYIADAGNSRIRAISAKSGAITTIAGTGERGYSGDGGPAMRAQLFGGWYSATGALAMDSRGNLYVADTGNQRIRKVSTNGMITTIAGNGSEGYSGDGGPATNAQLSAPVAVAMDAGGNLYIAEFGNNHRVRKVSPSGIISTVAGNGTAGHSGDGGLATSAQLNYPEAVAVDGAGNVYIADADCYEEVWWCSATLIRRVSVDGIITTVAGNGTRGYSGDGGPATSAQMDAGWGMAADGAGNLYVADLLRVRKVSASGTITTVAGNGLASYSGDGRPAAEAQLSNDLRGVALDAAGNLYIADYDNFRIRKVAPNGIISTVAGNGTAGFSGDGGPATAAQIGQVDSVAVDMAGNLYIADTYNYRIRKVSPGGIITTIAGNGAQGYSGDSGPATQAQLNRPVGVAADRAGDVYIADFLNNRIRKVSPGGIITTVAGDGTRAHSGDGGPAANAQIFDPYGPVVDGAGNLYFAELNHYTVRKVSSAGIITTVAGNGSYGYSGDGGPATNAQLFLPGGLALDDSGNLYIGDQLNLRVRKVSPAGIITTIAGNGTQGYVGDGGPAAQAQLSLPIGVAVDSAGNVYFADRTVVRLLEPDGPAPTITAITNAASNLLGPIAQGEIVVLYHSGIGPAQQTEFRLNDAGLVDTKLDRAQVTFNGTPAPLIYTWKSSLSAAVPYSISGANVQVQLTFRGLTSAAFTVPLAPASPGLFTMDASGTGQAVALDADGGYNSAQNPAKAGQLVVFYGTGEGQTSPDGIDGKLGTAPAPRPLLPVSLTIGGQPAELFDAGGTLGGVPGMVAGVMRIGAIIPSGIAPGNAVPVILQVGNASSQEGVTIAIAER